MHLSITNISADKIKNNIIQNLPFLRYQLFDPGQRIHRFRRPDFATSRSGSWWKLHSLFTQVEITDQCIVFIYQFCLPVCFSTQYRASQLHKALFPQKHNYYDHVFSLDFYDILLFREVEAEVRYLTHDVIWMKSCSSSRRHQGPTRIKISKYYILEVSNYIRYISEQVVCKMVFIENVTFNAESFVKYSWY